MSSVLERRYRMLLFTYPSEYRQRKSEEIVSTLLDTSNEGQRWPQLQEAFTLVTTGLTTRARLRCSASRSGVWIQGIRLASLCLLFLASVNAIMAIPQSSAFLFEDGNFWSTSGAELFGMAIFAVMASLAMLRGRPLLSLFAYLGYGFCSFAMSDVGPLTVAYLTATDYMRSIPIVFILPVIVTASLLVLSSAKRDVQPTKYSWFWLAAIVIAPLTPVAQALNGFASLQTAGVLALAVLFVIAVGWFDARFAIAVAIVMTTWALPFIFPMTTFTKGAPASEYGAFEAYWGRSPSTYILFVGFVVVTFGHAALSSRRVAMPALKTNR